MGDRVCLVADKVVETVRASCVDKAVSNPFSSSHTKKSAEVKCNDRTSIPLVYIGNDLERGLDSVLLDFVILDSSNVVVAVVSQDIEGPLTGEGDKLAVLRPVNL